MKTQNLKNFSNSSKRRKYLENKLKLKLENISQHILDEKKIQNRNCENMIGATQVPLGIAGPILLKQTNKNKRYYLPLATSEGALVASINRGCKVAYLSGGIKVHVEDFGVTRGPVWQVKGISKSREFVSWLEHHLSDFKKIAAKTSSYLIFSKLDTNYLGKNVYTRFYYQTGEAMGMNMATIATQKIVEYIEQKTKVKCVSLSGNYCVDKKPSYLNLISGRGKRAWAELVIKNELVKSILKTDPAKIVQVVKAKCLLGSAMSGSLAFNGHYANILAAIFLATGQDIAHIAELGLGITTAELEKNGDLYFSVYLPSLMIGTVGGGTHLPTQKEAFSILGLDKGKAGDTIIFAQIMAAAVLAGELSLLAALSAGHLAKAHQNLGRGKK